MKKVVSTFEELLEALPHDPNIIELEGLIRIPDARMGGIDWARPSTPKSKPFDINNPKSRNPLTNGTTSLIIPNGTGFVLGRNTTDPRTEGCITLICDVQAGAYPIFFGYRSGHIQAGLRQPQKIVIVKRDRGQLILEAPLNPGIPGQAFLNEKLALYFEGDPFGGMLEAGAYYYGSGSGNQLFLVRDGLGNVPFAPHMGPWEGRVEAWVARCAPSVYVRPANSGAPALSAWWGIVDFEGGKICRNTRMEAKEDGAGGYKLEPVVERDSSNVFQAIIDSYAVGESVPQHITGHVLEFSRMPFAIMRSILTEAHYGMQIKGPRRGAPIIYGNFGGRYAPAYGETENSLHFHEWSKHARGIITSADVVYDQLIETITINVWDGGSAGGSGDCPTDFALIYMPKSGSGENFKASHVHLRRTPYFGIRMGMHQNTMNIEDVTLGWAGSECVAISLEGVKGQYHYGGSNIHFKRIATVANSKAGVRIIGRPYGTIIFDGQHAEGPQVAFYMDCCNYESRWSPQPLNISARDLNLFSNKEGFKSKVGVLSAVDRSIVQYNLSFTDADLIPGNPGQINAPAHGFSSGETLYRSSGGRLPIGLENVDAYVHAKVISKDILELHYSSRLNRPVPMMGQSPGAKHYLLRAINVCHDGLLVQISGLAAAGIPDGPYQAWKPDRWSCTLSLGLAEPTADGSDGPWRMWPEFQFKVLKHMVRAGTNELQTYANVFPFSAGKYGYFEEWQELGLKGGLAICTAWPSSGLATFTDTAGKPVVFKAPPADWDGTMFRSRNYVPLELSANAAVGQIFALAGTVHHNGWVSLNLENVQCGDMKHGNNYTYFDGQLQRQNPEAGYVKYQSTAPGFGIKTTYKRGFRGNDKAGYTKTYECQAEEETLVPNRYGN